MHKSLKLHTSQRRRLRESIRRKRPQFWQSDDWYLLLDNSPAHRSQLVKKFLAKTRTSMLPHPQYSQDLAPWDFYIFPSMKKHLQGLRFMSSDEVKAAPREALREVAKNDFQPYFQKLNEHWKKCIVALGN
ncbi:mariner Mos1 transposase [Trichonephila clavipes]|nr:mariner Mos1 transposase [Trichonephila clavipes]